MITTQESTYFQKVILKLKLASGDLGLKPIYIGAHNGESFINQFSCSEHLENFGFGDDRLKECNFNCVIIFGNLNLIQQDLLMHILEKETNRIESVIYIQGPLVDELKIKSYFLSDNIEELIKPDVTYKKFPINFNELFSMIKEFQLERLHG